MQISKSSEIFRFNSEGWCEAVAEQVSEHRSAFDAIERYMPESEFFWRLLPGETEHQVQPRISGGFSMGHPVHGWVHVDVDTHGNAVGVEFDDRHRQAIEDQEMAELKNAGW